MRLSIRSVLPHLIAAIMLAFAVTPAHARPTDPAVKIDKIVDKTITKFEKTVGSYDKKVDSLVAKTTTKVAKMVAKGKPAEDINEVINKALMKGMGYAGTTRTKIDTTETAGMCGVEKYSAAPTVDDGEADIAEAADTCQTDINAIWDAAGTMLHALEVTDG